jgi:hypothetical protein
MKRFLATVTLVLAPSGLAFADQMVRTHTVEIGPEVYYHNYEEPGVMEQKGVFYGMVAGYEYHQRIYFRTDARTAFGQVDYSSPVSGTLDNIDDWLFESRATGGLDWNLSDQVLLTPFFGVGYRYLNDDSAGKLTSTGAAGYERHSNYFYSPAGLAVIYQPAPDWRLRASAEYDFFWFGQQRSNLSDAVAGLSDLENDQEDGYGLRGNLGLEKTGKKTDWWVEGFVRYWDIQDSETRPVTYLGQTIGLGYEPANETVEAGAVIGVRF